MELIFKYNTDIQRKMGRAYRSQIHDIMLHSLDAITNVYGYLALKMEKETSEKEYDKRTNDTDYEKRILKCLKEFWIPEILKLKIMKLTTQSNHVEAMEFLKDRTNAMEFQM